MTASEKTRRENVGCMAAIGNKIGAFMKGAGTGVRWRLKRLRRLEPGGDALKIREMTAHVRSTN